MEHDGGDPVSGDLAAEVRRFNRFYTRRAGLLDQRHAILFGRARVDGRFEHGDAAALEDRADELAGAAEQAEVGRAVLVDGGWD